MKTIIIPAILEKSFKAIKRAVQQIDGVAKAVQIDVVDGVYAPHVTWPFTADDSSEDVSVAPQGRELADRIECLYELRVPFEIDLMVQSPEDSLGLWLMTDAVRFILHRASTQFVSHCVSRIKDDGREVYLGLTPHDTFDGAATVLDLVDGVQCMGIEQVGAQGEPYTERIEPLIAAIRKAHPSLPIQVDGGVSAQTIPRLLAAGATQFAVGSALFTGDVAQNFARLQDIT